MKQFKTLKMEIKTIKKTETEGKLEMENIGKQKRTWVTSITDRMQEREERNSGTEYSIEDISIKERDKSKRNASLKKALSIRGMFVHTKEFIIGRKRE